MARTYTSKGERAPFDFELDGTSFVCAGNVDIIDLAELAALSDLDIDSVQGVSAISDIFKVALADDYARFRAHTRAHHTDNDTLFAILRDLVEHVTAGPTKRPSQSASGPLPTNGMSPADWPSRELTDEDIARLRAAIAGRS